MNVAGWVRFFLFLDSVSILTRIVGKDVKD